MYCIYVPAMDYNLLSIRQLAKKAFSVIIETIWLKEAVGVEINLVKEQNLQMQYLKW
jgi:hypothetical protein